MTFRQKEMWAVGWMDGLGSGDMVSAQHGGYDAYKRQFEASKFVDNMGADQVVRGLDQFYAGDYRNLTVPVQPSAVIVAQFAKGWITKDQVQKLIEAFRRP